VVQLINQGEDPHNLRVVRTDLGGAGTPAVDLPETGPQQQSTTTLSLAPGSYYLFCTLTTPKSHEQAGMHATLRVDP
jgi:plastocyanin